MILNVLKNIEIINTVCTKRWLAVSRSLQMIIRLCYKSLTGRRSAMGTVIIKITTFPKGSRTCSLAKAIHYLFLFGVFLYNDTVCTITRLATQFIIVAAQWHHPASQSERNMTTVRLTAVMTYFSQSSTFPFTCEQIFPEWLELAGQN